MNKFAVGYISFFDNVLKVEIIEAKDWKDALLKHSSIKDDFYLKEMVTDSESLEEATDSFYDCDMTIDIVEIK